MMTQRRAFRGLFYFLFAAIAVFVAGCAHPQPVVPESGDPGAVIVEGQLGSPVLLANGDSTVYARIHISTMKRENRERGAINIALVIDTSGSMEGAAIEEARSAAMQMIDSLKDGDRLSVITFHSKTDLLLPSSELSAEVRAEVKKRIARMKAEGTTDMATGLTAAIAEVRSHFIEKGLNRVVLLGDGIPNNNAAAIEETARRAGEGGIAITTMGLGLDYDETLMGKLALASGGRYKYIESADKLAGFFKEELERIDTIYGRNATAVLTAGPGVRIDAVVGAQDPPAGGRAFVQLGDISRGDERDIVVRMTVTPRKAGVAIELLDTTITFDDALESAGSLERHVYLGAHTTEDEAKVVKAHNPAVDLAAARAEAAATLILALELSKKGQYVRARDLLAKGADAALAQAKRTPSAELEKHAANMVNVKDGMPSVDPVAAPASSQKSDQGYGYSFSDDAMAAPMHEAPVQPSVARERKSAHEHAVKSLQ